MTSTTPEPARVAAKTSYVILRRVDGQGDDASIWDADPRPVKATSAGMALRFWAAKNGTGDGVELVAIPARSWQPRKVRVETSTKVTLG